MTVDTRQIRECNARGEYSCWSDWDSKRVGEVSQTIDALCDEVDRLRGGLEAIQTIIDKGFEPRFHERPYGPGKTIGLYGGDSHIPWGDGGEGDTWDEAIQNTLDHIRQHETLEEQS